MHIFTLLYVRKHVLHAEIVKVITEMFSLNVVICLWFFLLCSRMQLNTFVRIFGYI